RRERTPRHDSRRRRPQPRGAGRSGGTQRNPQAARHRLHRRVPRTAAKPHAERRVVQLVLVSGLSGSGKSIALRVLEDAGYYCVDNLPANFLMETVDFLADAGHDRAAVSIDARSAALPALPEHIVELSRRGVD